MITGSINDHCSSDKPLGYGLRSLTPPPRQTAGYGPANFHPRPHSQATPEPLEESRTALSEATDVVDVGFADLVSPERVAQRAVLEADDPSYAGTMTMTWHLAAADDGTEVTVTATDVPPGIDQADHEAGITSSLAHLASYVEAAS